METTKFVYWQDGAVWLGYLEEYPDYMTQGEPLDELKENLKDIYKDLTSGLIPSVRKVAVSLSSESLDLISPLGSNSRQE